MGIYKTALMHKKADPWGKGLNARPAGSPLSREEHETLVQQGKEDAEANTGWFKNVSPTKPSTWGNIFMGPQTDYAWHQRQNAMRVNRQDPVAMARRDAYLAGVNDTTSQYTANTRANASGGMAVATDTLNGLWGGMGDAYADSLGAGSVQDNLGIVRDEKGDNAARYWGFAATGANIGMQGLRDTAIALGTTGGLSWLGQAADKARFAHKLKQVGGQAVSLVKPQLGTTYSNLARAADKTIKYGKKAVSAFNTGATAYENKDKIKDAAHKGYEYARDAAHKGYEYARDAAHKGYEYARNAVDGGRGFDMDALNGAMPTAYGYAAQGNGTPNYMATLSGNASTGWGQRQGAW